MPIREHIEARFGSHSLGEEEAPGNPTLIGILERASCRQFEEEPIGDALLETLMAAAFSAPSKSDLQQRSVIVVRDVEKKRRIAALSKSAEWLADAPLFMVWCGDHRRFRRVAESRGHGFANDHLDTFFNASVDAAIAMQTFIIAAESAGLGCCPVSQIRNEVEKVSEELGLPNHVFPVAGLAVGWPAESTQVSQRLPLSLTVHTDQYQDPDDLLNTVSEYDQRREATAPTADEDQRNIERFGVNDDYGWSEDHARQYAVPARAQFGGYVRRKGFNLD